MIVESVINCQVPLTSAAVTGVLSENFARGSIVKVQTVKSALFFQLLKMPGWSFRSPSKYIGGIQHSGCQLSWSPPELRHWKTKLAEPLEPVAMVSVWSLARS